MSYPITLDIEGRICVVVGGGAVAARKVQRLLDSGARVVVISPELHAELAAPARLRRIEWRAQVYTPGLLAKYAPLLVFAATDSAHVNRAVAEEARSLGALVNVADGETVSDFSNMATVRRPPVTIAVSTDGASPALSVHLQDLIAEVVGEEYSTLAGWLDELRPGVRGALSSQRERKKLWERVLRSDALALLRGGDVEVARERVRQLVAEMVEAAR